jgi:hypothetical protein
MGLRAGQPPALALPRRCPPACASSRVDSVPLLFDFPARHAARAGRGEPAVQPVLVTTYEREWGKVVASNRLRWFGSRDACYLPDPEDADRFIAAGKT